MREFLCRKVMETDAGLDCLGLASDGEEALDLIDECMPDILITDIKMPVVSGLELIERAHRLNPDMHFVIVSGYSEFEYAQRAITLGVEDYVLKPVDPAVLRETLRKMRIKLEAAAGHIESQFGLESVGTAEVELCDSIELYLRENYNKRYSLERLAATFVRKPGYIVRLYKKIRNSTPTHDIIALRVGKAKQLLRHHRELEIKQIAALVGYDDALYFSRLFKKETGMSPSSFREAG